MQANQAPYSNFGLVQDMLETVNVIRTFDPAVVEPIAGAIRDAGRLFFTGEGSSRLFPSMSTIQHSRRKGWPLVLHSESGRQAQEYNLDGWPILAISNSGRTAEVIRLYNSLKSSGKNDLYSLTAAANSPLEGLANRGFVLKCGKEGAVAATKSVIEQALFCRALVEAVAGQQTLKSRLGELATMVETALTQPIPSELIDGLAKARTLYLSGRNDGVAEEMALKANEITRKHSDYLEGTYAVHGIEEVMDASDVVVWINPYPESEQKFQEVLVEGVGMMVIAISPREAPFPTIRIPDAGDLSGFVELAAGWSLLVEIGIRLGINLDKPQRARKVGNEFVG